MKTRRIGVAVSAHNPHAADQQIYRGIRDYSKENKGFECILTPFAARDLESAPASALPYDGILAQATPELVEIAGRLNIPVVDVWFDSRVTVPINCVFPDYAKAGRMAGQHLVSRGFENFGYVVNRGIQDQAVMCDGKLVNHDSLGYEAYIKAKGFKCARYLAPKDVHADVRTWRRWSQAIREWISVQPKPLALFVPNDMLCRHIADIASELGIHVPHDLGLVCADNEPNFCLLTEPSLTAIDLGYRRVGFEAAAMLDRLLAAEKPKRRILVTEPHALHPRHSTDATTVKDPLVAQAMRYILDNSHKGIKVRDVVRQMTTTRRTLERRFRSVLNRTVMQEITRCRIERLKRRLAESDDPIKSLLEGSGFNSIRMLYETFVREEEISPSAYRAQRRTRKKS